MGFTTATLSSVAKSIIADNFIAFANSLQTSASAKGTVVNFAFKVWDGVNMKGMATVKPVANLNAANDIILPEDNGDASFLTAVATWAANTGGTFTWSQTKPGLGDYMRIAMLMTSQAAASSFNYQPLNVSFRDNQIFPYVFTTQANKASYASYMTPIIAWTRVCTTCPNAFDSNTGGIGTASNPTWDDYTVSDISSSTLSILGSTYVYVWPNPPYLFFIADKSVAMGNDRIVITINDKCYCWPDVYGNNFQPPDGFFLCSDRNMPCYSSTAHKLTICHVPTSGNGNTLTVGYTSWGGHNNHPLDGVGSCDCFQWDGSGNVQLGDLPPQSLYQMSPDHFYGYVYVFGHDTRKAYVTTPSAPWIPYAETTITATAGQLVKFDFIEGPNMVFDEDGFLHSYQIIYVGYTGSPPSINTATIGLKTYPGGDPIIVSTDTSVVTRVCPNFNGTGVQLTPPCPTGANAGMPLLIRYRICNGCYCQESGTDGYNLLRINVYCPQPVAPVCRSETLAPIYVFPDVGASVSVNLYDYVFDGNGDTLTITVNTVSNPLGTVTYTQANGNATFSALANVNGTGTISYQVRDATATSATCILTIPIIKHLYAPEIQFYPSLNFVTPRETMSLIGNITVRYNPGVSIQIQGTNGQWVDSSYIYYVSVDGGDIRNVFVVDVLTIGSDYTATAQIWWMPTQYHLDGLQSNVTFAAVAADGATSSSVVVTFRVTPNIAPLGVATTITTPEDTPITFPLKCSDADWYHSSTITITAPVSQPANGAVTVASSSYVLAAYNGTERNFTFTPTANWFGNTTFSYTCTDALGASTTTVVNVTVLSVNDPPSSNNQTIIITEGVQATFFITGVDVDAIDKLAFISSNISLVGNQPGGPNLDVNWASPSGSVAVNDGQYLNKTVTTDRTWTFTYLRPLGANLPSTEVFAFMINDGTLNSSTYYITFVLKTNDPPTCTNVAFTTPEDTPLVFSLNSQFQSAAGASISGLYINGAPSPAIGVLTTFSATQNQTILNYLPYQDLTVNNQPASMVFVPSLNLNGVTSFTFFFRDNTFNKTRSPDCTATFTVTAVNDPPTLSITPLDAFINRTQTATFIATVTDVDSATVTVSWVDRFSPLNSVLTANGVTSSNTVGTFNLVNGAATFTITWTPSVTTPSGSSGYANFTAVDTQGLPATGPYTDDRITFRIGANLPPYHFSDNVPVIYEDQPSCGLITLIGSDPDVSDKYSLNMKLITTTQNGVLNLTSAAGFVSGAIVPEGTMYYVCYTPNPNYNGPDYFEIQYRDPLLLTSVVTRINLDVLPTNDRPVSRDINITLGWSQTAQFAFSGSDIDGDTLNLKINNDVSLLSGGTLFYHTTQVTTGMTLTTLQDDWVFTYNSFEANKVESFHFVVNDGTVDSIVYTVNIIVDQSATPNRPPITWNGTVTTNEDTPITVDLDDYSFDEFFDLHNIGVDIRDPMSGSTVGSFALDPVSKNLTFTPTLNYCGPAIVAFRATDSAGLTSNISYIRITVVCVNDPPTWTVTPSVVTTNRSVAGAFTYTLNDVDSSTVTITINASQLSALPRDSVLIIGGVTVDLTSDFSLTLPNPNKGTDIVVAASWTPSASTPDGSITSYWGQLADTEGLRAPDLQVTFTVNANIPPVAQDYSVTILENSNTPIVLPLQCTDGDAPHTRRLTETLFAYNGYAAGPIHGEWTGPTNNTVSYPAGTRYDIIYTPFNGYYGYDVFYFYCTDPVSAISNYAKVNITITRVNKIPTCRNITARAQTDGNATITLLGEDLDVNDQIAYSIVSLDITTGHLYPLPGPPYVDQVVGGPFFSIAAPWQFFYNASSLEQNSSFTYRVSDDYTPPGVSSVCTVDIIVTFIPPVYVNVPPVVHNITIIVNEDDITNFDFSDFITDPDGDTISNVFIGPSSLPDDTLLELRPDGLPLTTTTLTPSATGNYPIVVVPHLNQNGNTTFTYFAVDSEGHYSEVGYVTIVVLPVNDPPTITVDPTSLLLARTATGTVSFTIDDKDSDILTVTVLVNNVPVNSTLTYGSPASVVVNTPLIYTHSSGALPDTQSDYLAWTPLVNIIDGTTGSFQLQVTDDSGATGVSEIVQLGVIDNNPPTTYDQPCISAREETPLLVTLTGSDLDIFDRTTLDIIIVSLPLHGTLIYNSVPIAAGFIVPRNPSQSNSTATLSYTPEDYFRGSDYFTFAVRDHAKATSDPRTVCIAITQFVDHPPVASDLNLTVPEDYCVLSTCTVLSPPIYFETLSTSDPDGDATSIRFVNVGDTSIGRLIVDINGTFTVVNNGDVIDLATVRVYYQPLPNRNGVPYSFATFEVLSNPSGTVVTSIKDYTITINVLAVNDPPVGRNETFLIDMNEEITFTLLHVDIDDPADQLVVMIVDVPNSNRGVFRVNDTSAALDVSGALDGFNLTFTPDLNAYDEINPIATITYRVVDPHGAQSPIYYINVLVGFVPYEIMYKNETTLIADEDLELDFKVDRYGIDYFGGNDGLTDADLVISNVVDTLNGTFTYCDQFFQCTVITPNTNQVFAVPAGSLLTYTAGPNLFGDTALTFDLTLIVHTGAPNLTVPFTINVRPVNDPPVLIPGFNTLASGLKNECDEDTYIIINFHATDIDNTPDELRGDLIQFLFQGAPGDYYNCNNKPVGLNQKGDCMLGDPLVPGQFVAIDNEANFRFVFVPKPNVNGIARLLIQAVDPSYAASAREIVEITVLPINDPPAFAHYNFSLGKVDNSSQDKVTLFSDVTDIDFIFGYNLSVTYTLLFTAGGNANSDGNGNSNTSQPNGPEALGYFELPPNSPTGDVPPCTLSDDLKSITCNHLIEKVNPWIKGGIVLVLQEGVQNARIELFVNDLGNIDKNPGQDKNASVIIDVVVPLGNLVGAAKPPTNNVALIAAPIAGLLAGAIIAGLIFAIKRKQAKANVESYFDRFALGMEGATNSSPLYQGATKGGESPIYRAGQ